MFRPQLPSEEKGSEQIGNRQDLPSTLTGWDTELGWDTGWDTESVEERLAWH